MSWNRNYIKKIKKILIQCHIKNKKKKNKIKQRIIKILNKFKITNFLIFIYISFNFLLQFFYKIFILLY